MEGEGKEKEGEAKGGGREKGGGLPCLLFT